MIYFPSNLSVCLQNTGTTAEMFREFIFGLLQRLPRYPSRVFIWDNLSSHYDPEVALAIYEAGHCILPRPPYSPQDGPIEYVFNTVEVQLRLRMYEIFNNFDLERTVYDIVAHIGNTDAYFRHCGYGNHVR